nr:ribonuclease H-like domain-containing protein [Tanacetum cinerariifolium]
VQKKAWSNSQNIDFISSSNTMSGKSKVPIVQGTFTASAQVPTVSTEVAAASLSYDTLVLKNQKWNALIATRWVILLESADHQEVKTKRRESYKKDPKVEEPAPKAVIAINGIGWDWSYMAKEDEVLKNHALVADEEEVPTEYALMAESSSSSDNEVYDDFFCSKSCKKNTENLNTKISKLNKELSDCETDLYNYKRGLSQVKARLVKFKENEIKYFEKIRVIERDIKLKDNKIEYLRNELAEVKKEKESIDFKIEKIENALKDLHRLLGSQKLDKDMKGVGFNEYCAVLPPPAQVYSPPKKDLSWMGLPELVDDTVADYTRPTPSIDVLKSVTKEQEERWKTHSNVKRSFERKSAAKNKVWSLTVRPKILTVGSKVPAAKPALAADKGNKGKVVKASARIPHDNIDDKGYWDSGFSRHMTGNISYLSEYEPFNGGYVSFGHGRGKIIGKGSIKTGKFDAKGDDGYFVGYSLGSKALRFFNKRTKKIEENLHVDFLENKSIEKGTGPDWLSDIDTLTNSMNYVLVVVSRTSSTNISGTKEDAVKKDDAIPKNNSPQKEQQEVNRVKQVPESSRNSNPTISSKVSTNDSFELASSSIAETEVPTVSSPVPPDSQSVHSVTSSVPKIISKGGSSFPKPLYLGNAMSFKNRLEDFFEDSSNEVSLNKVEVDVSNIETAIQVSPTPTLRIHKDHPKSQIIGLVNTPVQTRKKTKDVDECCKSLILYHSITDPYQKQEIRRFEEFLERERRENVCVIYSRKMTKTPPSTMGGGPNGKLIHNSILNGPYVRKMIPEPGDANRDITNILLGLPEDIYAAVDSYETAQEIWLRVQQMMKGSDIGIQEKKAKLFNEWERFTSNEGESIESYYHRFLKLMNDLQIAQPGMNMGQDRQMQMVGEEYDLMTAAADLDEIEEVNANCILMANLQHVLTSGTQTDNALIYDTDGSAEVHENCDDNEIFNMFTQEEQYTELLEPISELHQVPQNVNEVISEDTGVEQGGETVEQHPANFKETHALYESLYQNLAIEVEKVNSVNRKLKETNADLTTELARFKNQESCFEISQEKYDKLERCYQQSVYQEQCLSKKINALHLSTGKQIMTLNE